MKFELKSDHKDQMQRCCGLCVSKRGRNAFIFPEGKKKSKLKWPPKSLIVSINLVKHKALHKYENNRNKMVTSK